VKFIKKIINIFFTKMQLNDITRFEEQDEETAGQDIVRFIRQEPGKLKQTNINICGYEMH
jgi:hypothetical protein